MRKGSTNIHKTARSRPGRMHAQSALPFGRILAGGTLLVLLMLVCIWVPIAWADAASSDQYPTSEQIVEPVVEKGTDSSAVTDTGSPLTAEMPAENTPVSDADANTTATSPDAGSATPAGAVSGGSGTADSTGAVTGGVSSGGSDDCDNCGNDSSTSSSVAQGASDGAAADQYNLTLECKYGNPGVYWENWDDYVAGLLSVDYKLTNNGPGTANNLYVATATATNKVTLASILPELGDLEAGEFTIFTLKWLIPSGVKNFTTELTICSGCNDDDDDLDDDDDDSDDDSDDDDGDEGKDDDGDDDDDNSLVDDNSSNDDPAIDTSGQGTTTSNSITAAIERGSLPMTGLSLVTALLIALGVVTPLGMLFMPIAKLIRVRRK